MTLGSIAVALHSCSNDISARKQSCQMRDLGAFVCEFTVELSAREWRRPRRVYLGCPERNPAERKATINAQRNLPSEKENQPQSFVVTVAIMLLLLPQMLLGFLSEKNECVAAENRPSSSVLSLSPKVTKVRYSSSG